MFKSLHQTFVNESKQIFAFQNSDSFLFGQKFNLGLTDHTYEKQ